MYNLFPYIGYRRYEKGWVIKTEDGKMYLKVRLVTGKMQIERIKMKEYRKLMRRLGEPIPRLTKKEWIKKATILIVVVGILISLPYEDFYPSG